MADAARRKDNICNYDLRMIFQFVRFKGEEAILLQAVGTHDSVY